jgi:hypothetical protein
VCGQCKGGPPCTKYPVDGGECCHQLIAVTLFPSSSVIFISMDRRERFEVDADIFCWHTHLAGLLKWQQQLVKASGPRSLLVGVACLLVRQHTSSQDYSTVQLETHHDGSEAS